MEYTPETDSFGVPVYTPGTVPQISWLGPPSDLRQVFYYPARTELYVQLHEQRKKLNQGLRERGYYPDAEFPADCFIAESAGLDLTKLATRESLAKKGWYQWVRTEATISRVFRQYSREAQAVIDEWWDLLSPEVRSS